MSRRVDPFEAGLLGCVGLIVLTTVALILGSIIYTVAGYQNDKTWTCHVIGKESVARDKGHAYRVYTEDCGNFVVADALWRGHFTSSDVYVQVEVGKTNTFDTIGFRVPFLSDFPNIVEVHQ